MSNSTLAPSEKHLEDWIVANQERFGPSGVLPSTGQFIQHQLIDKLIGRQVNLPSGRLDLLAINDLDMTLVELKKGKGDAEAIAQTIRYINDLKQIHFWTLYRISHLDNWEEYNYHYPYLQAPPKIKGVLVCHGLASPKLEFSCMGSDIDIIEYRYSPDDDSYSFRYVYSQDSRQLEQAYQEFSHGFIGDAFIGIEGRWSNLCNQKGVPK